MSAEEKKVTTSNDGTEKVEGEYVTTVHADGSETVKGPGMTAETDEGTARVKLDQITKISIDNVLDVKSHEIKHTENAASHYIIFRNDGAEMRLTYRLTGEIIEFSTRNLGWKFGPGGVVTVMKGRKDTSES